MSTGSPERGRSISKRKLVENVFLGVLGVSFTVFAVGDTTEYLPFILNNVAAVLVGVITGILVFYLVEMTTAGNTVETSFRESQLLTAVVLFGLLLVAVGIIELAGGSNSESGVAWVIGFSVIVPIASVISYLRGRGSTADLDLS
ncbi:hypothetical protein [Haloterrigena alkaliphila]|uniref:Uncharacterized protein n=1 Tax=Haloterrigena alkaliphila TaxID=2816475 RepID=A0A8A2VDS8_9EURY|nr:hypothetical protein [Haloterrigena alkaliphila]QSX00234.1 hypothetical protein J0X25_04515 [Haloterrigena alkaliphila]